MRAIVLKTVTSTVSVRRIAAIFAVIAGASAACASLKDGSVPAPSDRDAAGPFDSGGTTKDIEAEAVEADASDDHEDAAADADATTDAPQETDLQPPESGADATDAGAFPVSAAALQHLRLWLMADRGVQCVAPDASAGEAGIDGGVARVTAWADQSGHNDDATLKLGQLGPQCQTGHVVQGVDLPYFSAPKSLTNPNIVDETLDVDLSFLANSEYTFFAIERRWADYAIGNPDGNEDILGTTWSPAVEALHPSCAANMANDAVFFGYIYYADNHVELTLDQSCNTLRGFAPAVPAVPPASLSRDTGMLSFQNGHEAWIEGAPVAIDPNTSPIMTAGGGAIGRGLVQTMSTGLDPRYRGDIAEILVFDTALETADRIAVETYLHRWQ